MRITWDKNANWRQKEGITTEDIQLNQRRLLIVGRILDESDNDELLEAWRESLLNMAGTGGEVWNEDSLSDYDNEDLRLEFYSDMREQIESELMYLIEEERKYYEKHFANENGR